MREDEDHFILDIAPEYFPGVDLCAAMCRSNSIILDCSRQYIRQSFQNRAKVRTPDGWQWLSIPLEAHQHGRSIQDLKYSDDKDWRRQHMQSLRFNYRSTPFFEFIEPRIEAVLFGEDQSFADIVVESTRLMVELMGLACSVHRRTNESKMEGYDGFRRISIDRLSPRESTTLKVRMSGLTYRQNFDGFVDGLSGLDLIFNYGPEAFTVLNDHIIYHD